MVKIFDLSPTHAILSGVICGCLSIPPTCMPVGAAHLIGRKCQLRCARGALVGRPTVADFIVQVKDVAT